ncbi:hypothetical protein PSAB6_60239 [Paraburkholderia sabiae]|nr:hypothetical protein PSAB6_60239 [Paraburkholderia sabiae]
MNYENITRMPAKKLNANHPSTHTHKADKPDKQKRIEQAQQAAD